MMGRVLLWIGVLLSAAVEAGVSSSHLFSEAVSAQQGCERAIEKLKVAEIGRRCGMQLSGGQLRVLGDGEDRLDRLLFETSAGLVTRFELLSQQVEMVKPLPESSLFRCRVEAELEVRCNQGRRDPAFAPLFSQQVTLNQTRYRDGEEMVVQLQLEQPGYITILQWIPYLQHPSRVWRLFPGADDSSNHFPAAASITIPDQDKRRYQWIASLPKGEARVVEELVVIASKEPVHYPQQMSVEGFHRLLSEIPLAQRRELYIPYEIVPTDGGGGMQ